MASTSVIGKTTAVPPADLNLFHLNPREGDVPAIMASLRRHNQYAPITVNLGTHTGRPREILKGNHTTLAFRRLAEEEPDDPRWRKILVFWIDVDDDMANRIVTADNQTGQLGGFNTDKLLALIETFNGDTAGLGFTEADIDDLMALQQENDASVLDKVTGAGSDGETGPRDDGLVNAKDMTTRQDEYAENAANRMIVLTLPIARFIWAQEHLEAARKEFDVETNTDAVVALLEQWSDTTAPPYDTPIPEGADLGLPGGGEGYAAMKHGFAEWRGTGSHNRDDAEYGPGGVLFSEAIDPAAPEGFTE